MASGQSSAAARKPIWRAMRGVFADGSADAEVEGVDHLAVLLDLLAFEADVGDPVLAAGVGAAGDVEA